MPKPLLEQRPKIVANRLQAYENIIKSFEGRHRAELQAREWVLPARDSAAADRTTAGERQAHLAAGQQGAGTTE